MEAVCLTGSISAAAAELYVSRTVISRALHELEDEFGTSLFTRTRTGMALTPSGEIIRDCCRHMRSSFDITQARINSLSFEDTRSPLRFALSPTCGSRLFPEFFSLFRRVNPDIPCTISEMPAFDTIESVRNGTVDFAITPVCLPSESCQDIGRLFLHTIETVVCVGRNDPFSHEAFLSREQIEPREFVTLNATLPLPYPIKVIMRISQADLFHKVVASSMAIGLLPADFARSWEDVVCIPFRDPVISDVHIIWSNNLPHSADFHRFVSFAESYDKNKLKNY